MRQLIVGLVVLTLVVSTSLVAAAWHAYNECSELVGTLIKDTPVTWKCVIPTKREVVPRHSRSIA